MSRSTTCRCSTGRSGARWRCSTLVRKVVSGVRSSWLASATRRCCCSRDVASAATIVLRLWARLPTSPGPSVGNGVDRSSVAAMSSAASRSRRTGRTMRPARSHPRAAAPITPARVRRTSRSFNRSSVDSVSDRSRAIWNARTVPPRLRQLPVADAVDGGRAQQWIGVGARGDGEVAAVDGQLRTLVDALGEATVGGDDLRRRGGLQRTDGRAAQERSTGTPVVAVAAHQGGGTRHERLVDRGRQLADRRHVGAHAGEGADQRGDEGQAEGDAPTEAHGILST